MVRNPPVNVEDVILIPGLGKIPWRKKWQAHSSILLAWVIPWTEEPGGLQSMGSQKSWTQLND